MKKIILALAVLAFMGSSCGSSKQSPDYDKVDESFDEFKKKNPDSD
jgi:hypothetical protein